MTEVVITVALVALLAAVPAPSLVRSLAGCEARMWACVSQSGALSAQTRALWSAEPASFQVDGEGAAVLGGDDAPVHLAREGGRSALTTNLPRWRFDGGVRVRFLPVFASPDGAGSWYVGPQGSGQRVVIRAESGLSRREAW